MSNDDPDVVLELSLLDNGIDFILKGIDELFDDNYIPFGYSDPAKVLPNRYKYGYLHLFSGFLLLLKARLVQHAPELIFKGTMIEVRQKLANNKTPNTVDLDEALNRLEMGPRVVFSEPELKVIRMMQDFRNKFEHYEVSANKHQLWNTVSEFLVLIYKFMIAQLRMEIEGSDNGQELQEKIQDLESVNKHFIAQREKEWLDDALLRREQFQVEREDVIHDLHREHHLSKGVEIPFTYCSECGAETMIISGDYAGICCNPECDHITPLTGCDRCGEMMEGFSWDFNICDSCQSWIAEQ